MRGIGKGQTVAVLLFPDMVARIRRDLGGFSDSAANDVLEWLVLRDVASQVQQNTQTRVQDVHQLWKSHMFKQLAEHDVQVRQCTCYSA